MKVCYWHFLPKLIIYCNKFKTSNLLIKNNSSPSIGVLQKTNVIYQFKCPLGDCISKNNDNIYVGLTSTILSRRLTMHLSDTSPIAQHLKKKNSCPTTELWKIRTYKSYIPFLIHPLLMMAQSWAESTWEITNYGRIINQFSTNIIRSIRQFKRINKKYVDKKNQIYIYIYKQFYFKQFSLA